MPGPRDTRSIPSLDGLRAVSVALVILAHAQGTRGFPASIPGWLADHGTLGVHIFFVISGFLITRLLLDERASTGGISLRLFYARRTLRIFPPFYVFLAVLALGGWIGFISVNARNLLFAATYTMNYLPSGGMWVTGHIWSLSVEEQFYLVWPLAIRLAGERRALWIAAVLAIASPYVCLAVYLVNHDFGSTITKYFPLVFDSIAAGCALAGVLPRLRANPRIRAWLAAPLGDLAAPMILILDLGRSHPRVHMAFTETALNICICYAIARYTEYPSGPAGRFLNVPWIAAIGRMSYSLYLWQQIFMNAFATGFLARFPINIAASLACAMASYYTIELPLAGLRKRLRAAPPASFPASVESARNLIY